MDALTVLLLVLALAFVVCGVVLWRRRSAYRPIDGTETRYRQNTIAQALQSRRNSRS